MKSINAVRVRPLQLQQCIGPKALARGRIALDVLLTFYFSVHASLAIAAVLLNLGILTLPFHADNWVRLEMQSHKGLPCTFGALGESMDDGRLAEQSVAIRAGLLWSDLSVQVPALVRLPIAWVKRDKTSVPPTVAFIAFVFATTVSPLCVAGRPTPPPPSSLYHIVLGRFM